MKAHDVMSSPVVFLRPRVPADAAAALLVSHGFTAAPVVDDDGGADWRSPAASGGVRPA